MKVTLFATVSMIVVVGFAVADEMFNNWNNNDDGFGGISGGFGGMSQGFGGMSQGFGGMSQGLGGISGGLSHMGGGYSSGYGAGYGSGYGAGYDSKVGYGSGYGSVSGYGLGSGYGKAAYVPVPAVPKAGGSGIGSLLPIFFLLFLLPQLFNRSSTSDNIVLLNSTLEG